MTNESDKAGDLGYTPLHVAWIQGHTEMVKLLIDRGANLFTLSEGDAPIYDGSLLPDVTTSATCWSPLMTEAQSVDPKIWVRTRIAQLSTLNCRS